jgi:bisphosphoglycerate-dependent phosphoglycerate mutase
MVKKGKPSQRKKDEAVPSKTSLPLNLSDIEEDEDCGILQDFSSRISPFVITNNFSSGSHSVTFPALSVMPPQVLFFSAEDCIRKCRGGRKMTEYEKTLHKKANILMMTLFSRSSFMSTRWAPFLSGNGSRKKDLGSDIPPSLAHSHHHPNCPCNAGCSGVGFGARLYSHMLHMKNRLMTCSQYIADGDTNKTYDERLANYWASLDLQSRISLVAEEMEQLKTLIFWNGRSNTNNNKSSSPTFHTMCSCSMCSYRRVSIKDLVEQVHRAFWEEMSRFVSRHPWGQEEDESFARVRRPLYRNIAILCHSLLRARSRPVIDLISEFAGLKFNDNPPYKQAQSPGRGSSSSDSSDFETESDSHEEGLSCTCEGVFIEDLDPYGFDNDGLDPEDIDPFLDTLDYSDDEVMLDSLNDLETPIDTAFFVTPVVTAASLSNEQDEKLINEGRELFIFFASELFHHRLVLGYLQKATFDRQTRLLMEEEESEKLNKEKELSKQQAKKRKKERQKLLKLQKQEPEKSLDQPTPESNENEDQLKVDEPFLRPIDSEQIRSEFENEEITEKVVDTSEDSEDDQNLSSIANTNTSFSVSDIEGDLLKSKIEGENVKSTQEATFNDEFGLENLNPPEILSCNELENEVIRESVREIEKDEINNLFKRLEQELKLLQLFVDTETTPPGFELSKTIPPINEVSSSLPTFWWQDGN